MSDIAPRFFGNTMSNDELQLGWDAPGAWMAGLRRTHEQHKRVRYTMRPTYGYDANGNLTTISSGAAPVTMVYDKENRLSVHKDGAALTTFSYDGDGKKRTERSGAALTTLIWDGDDYLGERS
jgi:YD repeat-containing protein